MYLFFQYLSIATIKVLYENILSPSSDICLSSFFIGLRFKIAKGIFNTLVDSLFRVTSKETYSKYLENKNILWKNRSLFKLESNCTSYAPIVTAKSKINLINLIPYNDNDLLLSKI